jgi:hypothetical protein
MGVEKWLEGSSRMVSGGSLARKRTVSMYSPLTGFLDIVATSQGGVVGVGRSRRVDRR